MGFFLQDNRKGPQPFTSASDWTPTESKLHPQVPKLIDKDLHYFDYKLRQYRSHPNLSEEEMVALKELTNNKSIILKPADKGSSVVIMDKNQYIWEANRQLNDTKYYKKLQQPIFPDTVPLVENIVNSLFYKNFIDNKQRNYLLGSKEPRPQLFYLAQNS